MSVFAPHRSPLPPAHPTRGRHVWAGVALAVAAVGILAVGGSTLRASNAPSTSPPGSLSTSSSTSPSSSSSASSSFRFLPLWPFADVQGAVAWQQQALPGGHQPWRLDAGTVAVSFATDLLGYPEVDRATSVRISGDEAWVGVGSPPIEGRQVAAGVLHLARIGTGELATRPWEVVGSDDTTLTLTTPRYGAVVGSPLVVGGRISGIDESLAVQVRTPDGRVLGRLAGLGAGGADRPWTATLALDVRSGGLAVVAVSTGGHLRQVERFAITGVRVRPEASVPVTYPTADGALASTVARGHYVGACSAIAARAAGATATGTERVCSVLLTESGARHLYRVGYWRTDAGYYVVLSRTAAGRWQVVAANLAGQDVPADLGGPLSSAGSGGAAG